jgi:hypothetical protein
LTVTGSFIRLIFGREGNGHGVNKYRGHVTKIDRANGAFPCWLSKLVVLGRDFLNASPTRCTDSDGGEFAGIELSLLASRIHKISIDPEN